MKKSFFKAFCSIQLGNIIPVYKEILMVKFELQVQPKLCILSFACPQTACDSEAALCHERTQRLEKSIPGEASPTPTIKTKIYTSTLSTVSEKTYQKVLDACVSVFQTVLLISPTL